MEIPPASPEKKKEIKQQQKSNNKPIKNENKYKHHKTKKFKKIQRCINMVTSIEIA